MPNIKVTEHEDGNVTASISPAKPKRYSYLNITRAEMEAVDAWWVLCPHCEYDGPEPPLPALEPRPGHHEVWMCPSCRGILPRSHSQVARMLAEREAGPDDE